MLAAVLLVPMMIACSDNGPGTPMEESEYLGGYELLTINGNPLPATLSMEDGDITVTRAYLNLLEDKRWTVFLEGEAADESPVTLEVQGAIESKNRSLVLIDDDPEGANITVTFNGDKVTLKIDGEPFVLVLKRMPPG